MNFAKEPPELFLNADETSFEVGLQRKIILPAGETKGRKVDKFTTSSQITSTITINVIAPLKRMPKDIEALVASGKITIGGSPNG